MAAQKRVPLACCPLRAAAARPCQYGMLGSGVWGLWGALGLRLAPLGASSRSVSGSRFLGAVG